MSNSFITIIAIFLSAVLMFVFPIISMADKADTNIQTDIETSTVEFANQIKTTGKLTLDNYNKFIQDITSTGNIYNIEFEFKILDENSGKKASQTVKDKVGENVYYSVYTTQIQEILDSQGAYCLKQGDIIYVSVKNTNYTLAQQVKNLFYTISGNNLFTIQAAQAGLVTANGML